MIRPENILQIDSSGITGGGGSVVSSQLQPTLLNQTTYDTYIFTLISNEKVFDAIVNGETLYNTKSVRISKETLLKGPITIKISKSGYKSNEYYEVDFDSTNSTIIRNTFLNRTLGLSTTDVSLKYYVGNLLQNTTILAGSNTKTLDFKLTKSNVSPTENEEYKLSISVSGKGTPVSVL